MYHFHLVRCCHHHQQGVRVQPLSLVFLVLQECRHQACMAGDLALVVTRHHQEGNPRLDTRHLPDPRPSNLLLLRLRKNLPLKSLQHLYLL